ncbi:MAG: LCP family protein [Synergistetes bacterium]|nr:LCP family protein [Synergistota bacterium]MCX8128439.1 LCP family protein [Synergistota bacterium]MDW8193140.1 LCP family protein [Synergistota bacterium]
MVMRSIFESKVIFIALALIGVIVGGGIRLYSFLNPDINAVKASLVQDETKPLNILFVGIDSVEGSHRADVIALITLDLNKRKIGVISIPRDTRVRIPNRGWTKINHAYAYGGISLLKDSIEEFLAIRINHYVSMDYQGFVRIIDLIGGVELYIEKDMRYTDKWAGFYINLKKGYQRLDGNKALQYVRFRNDPEGDIGRIKRQKRFIEAIVDKLKKEDILNKLPSIAIDAIRFVKTDLTPEQIIYLISFFKGFDLTSIKWEIVPGTPGSIDGVSYWLPDLEKLSLIRKKIILGEEDLISTQEEILTIEVLNGNGILGAATHVAKILEAYGYKVIKMGNAERLDYPVTKVIDNTGQNYAIAKKIVEILGYGISSSEKKESQASITVILGKDMKK